MATIKVCDDCGVKLDKNNTARTQAGEKCIQCHEASEPRGKLVPDEEVSIWRGERVGPRRGDY